MTDENLNFDINDIEFHIITLFEKLDDIRKEKLGELSLKKLPVRAELRTVEFWKSLISESVASFIYVFVVCGANAASRMGSTSPANVFLFTALSSGFAMTFLTNFFGKTSGAHVNPAVSIAMGSIKRISLLRTFMFIVSQCTGAVAGAAFLYGITVPGFHGYQENLSSAIGHPSNIFTSVERFGIELTVTFMVVFAYFISMDSYRKWNGSGALTIGFTYCACSLVFMPYLNPARALGPSFVLNKWDSHWIDWLGPMLGGLAAGLSYEYIFNPHRVKKPKKPRDEEASSIPSDDDLNYDDVDKPQPPKFHGSTYNTYRSTTGIDSRSNYCPSLFGAPPPPRLERVESLYGGTKSLCRSPPLTRANLNRSQSVYTKSNTAINRELLPKSGPLVPAQSMYPMRLNQQSHLQNQNVHNQMQQRSDQLYGVRGVTPGTSSTRTDNYSTTERQRDNFSTNERKRRENYSTTENTYGGRNNPPSSSDSSDQNIPPQRARRPESVYAMLGSQGRGTQKPITNPYPETRNVVGAPNPTRPPPPPNGTILTSNPNQSNYHVQHSPNPQY